MARKPAPQKTEPAVEASRKHAPKPPDPITGRDLEAIRVKTGWSPGEFASRIGFADEGEYWMFARDPNASGVRPPRLVPEHAQAAARALRDHPPAVV